MKSIYPIFFTVLFSVCCTAQNATRVVAFAKFGADTTLPCADSGGYKYLHGRSGYISFTPFPYNFYEYPFVIVPETDFETGFCGLVKSDSSWELSATDTDISMQYFDNQFNIIYATCNKKNNGIWQPYLSRVFGYDGAGNEVMTADSNYISGVWQNSDLYNYEYNSQNELTKMVEYSGKTDSGGWFIIDTVKYLYDSSKRLIRAYGGFVENNFSGSSRGADTTISQTVFNYMGNLIDTMFIFDTISNYPFKYDEAVLAYYFSPAGDSLVVNQSPFGQWIRRTTTYDSRHNVTAHIQEVLVPGSSTAETPFIKKWTYNANNQVTCERDYKQDTSGQWIFSGRLNFITRIMFRNYRREILLFQTPFRFTRHLRHIVLP